MATSVIGSFDDRSHAERVLRELERAGYADGSVSGVEADGHETPIVAHDHSRTVLRAAFLSGAACAVIGGALVWLASLGARPEAAPFLTSGPFVAILSGVLGGGAAGLLAGSLIGLGMRQAPSESDRLLLPRQKMRVYVRSLDADDAPNVERILASAGAEEISVRAESSAAHEANTTPVWKDASFEGEKVYTATRERNTDSIGDP
jgi:hypothetical protein